jgi:hypothetical protein
MILNSLLLPLLLLVKGKILFIYSLLILTEYVFILCFGESSRPLVLEFFVDGEWLMTCLLLFGLGLIG